LAIALSAERAVAGRFGPYGGRYVPETLVAALDDLTALYDAVRVDPAFWAEYEGLLSEFVGRPSPLTDGWSDWPLPVAEPVTLTLMTSDESSWRPSSGSTRACK
jgi:hypothetical protein